jgi:hypothetical protein
MTEQEAAAIVDALEAGHVPYWMGDMYDADLYCRCGHWSAGQEPQPHLLWIEHAKSSPVPLTLAVGDLS